MVKVTREQMKAVETIKSVRSLEYVLNVIDDVEGTFNMFYKHLNDMTVEQIVLAWHGYVELEPEYVGFDEAMKALKKNERVTLHILRLGEWLKIPLIADYVMSENYIDGYSFEELFAAEYTIDE